LLVVLLFVAPIGTKFRKRLFDTTRPAKKRVHYSW
jgi:hypothetical protein